MYRHAELMETRRLFSNVGSVTADYDAVVADAAAIKSTMAVAVATYKVDAKAVAADVKALPKSKTKNVDAAALNKAVGPTDAADVADAAKLIAIGRSALTKARLAYAADVARPSTANEAKLEKAVSVLSGALAAPEAKLNTAVDAGDAKVDAALSQLESDYPTDAALSSAVTTAETDQSNAVNSVNATLATTNADVATLVDDIS